MVGNDMSDTSSFVPHTVFRSAQGRSFICTKLGHYVLLLVKTDTAYHVHGGGCQTCLQDSFIQDRDQDSESQDRD